ncbi:hypothetical protein LC607_10910 [Nostoc sp. CHAB 5824]|nr:hypothetical protein [Nostoc sp. CHAB 5824]
MAIWSDVANTQMATIATNYHIPNAQLSTLRVSISQWADMIGSLKRKAWPVGNYTITATVENHEVLTIEIDM